MNQKNRGITLVALIVTIIILLILAGVTVATLIENGLFEKTKLAKEKQENAEIKEDETLGDYENKIGEYISGGNRENTNSNINESTVITNAELTIKNLGKTNFDCDIKVTCENNEDILDYHIYLENKTNSIKKAYTGSSNPVKIEGLISNTKYNVYAIVCDIYGNFRKTNSIEVQTLDADPIIIDAVNVCNPNWRKLYCKCNRLYRSII